MIKLLFAMTCSLAAIEHSVIPTVEFTEEISNLPSKKYTKNQFREIDAALQKKENKLRLVTFNMLRSDLEKNIAEENHWIHRLPRIVETLQEMNADLIGAQELTNSQLNELIAQLPHYSFFGNPRKDGEINAILYRKDRLALVEGKTLTTPSGKNALNIARFTDLKTSKQFVHFNIHASFSRIDEREDEANLIVQQAALYDIPILLSGDLNTFPNRTDLLDLPFYDGDYFNRILTQDLFRNSAELSLLGHLGPISTFTNRGLSPIPFQGTGTPGILLDHIYVSKKITVLINAVQPATVDDHFPSDHMPVMIDFLVQ